MLADQGQGVGQREDDQVVLLVGRPQVRPAVVDVRDPRVLVRVVGVILHADLLDGRVDLHGVHVARAVGQGDGHVGAAARPHDQHLLVGLPGNQL